jgi:hypothetical protein
MDERAGWNYFGFFAFFFFVRAAAAALLAFTARAFRWAASWAIESKAHRPAGLVADDRDLVRLRVVRHGASNRGQLLQVERCGGWRRNVGSDARGGDHTRTAQTDERNDSDRHPRGDGSSHLIASSMSAWD